MSRPLRLVALAALVCACHTPLERGERLYREGDRLGALETWRAVSEDHRQHEALSERIATVEAEFDQLVARYKQRGRYFEERGRLAESILNYRLALKLQPEDDETLRDIQELARRLVRLKEEIGLAYREAFDTGDLLAARVEFERLRKLDAFDPEIENEERRLAAAVEAEVAELIDAGRRAFTEGRLAEAREELRTVAELDPGNEVARGYLAYLAATANGTDAAGQEPFASRGRLRADTFYRAALEAERAGDLFTAIRNDERALRADPGHERAGRHLAQLREQLGDDVEPLIEKGREAFRNEDLQSALDYWRLALLIEPENERTRAYVARAERQLSDLERLRSEPGASAAP